MGELIEIQQSVEFRVPPNSTGSLRIRGGSIDARRLGGQASSTGPTSKLFDLLVRRHGQRDNELTGLLKRGAEHAANRQQERISAPVQPSSGGCP